MHWIAATACLLLLAGAMQAAGALAAKHGSLAQLRHATLALFLTGSGLVVTLAFAALQ